MNNVANSKRVFYIAPHMVVGYADILGGRGDVTLDRLEHDSPADVATPILSAAHVYQTSATRDELAELFSLLAFAPTRCLVAGIWSPWSEASTGAIEGFLARWRDSRFALLRSAYGALHQLVLAAWYAQGGAWPAIGYAGPPPLSVG